MNEKLKWTGTREVRKRNLQNFVFKLKIVFLKILKMRGFTQNFMDQQHCVQLPG